MGWTGIYTDRSSKDVVIEALTHSSEKFGSSRVVDIAKKGSTFYCAWEKTNPDGKKYTLCMVMLTSRKDGEVCYKEVDECMGPCESECPKRILDLLSPVEDFAEPDTSSYEYATNWRQRCRAALNKPKAKPVADLDVIKLVEPLSFTNGVKADTFIVRKHGRTGRKLRFLCDGITYRISKFNAREFTIIGKVDPFTNKIVPVA